MTLSGTWQLDPTHSTLGFSVRHAGISKVRGEFGEATGTVVADEDGSARIEGTVQASSFTSGNADRDGHVKSADFLDVEAFPTLDFNGVYDGEEIQGHITIHGVTQPITFATEVFGEATDPFGNQRVGAEATATISRKDFGLTWNAALDAGGVLVGDKVALNLDLSFIKA